MSRDSRGGAGWLLLNAGLVGLIAFQAGGLNLLPAVRAAAPETPAAVTAPELPPAFVPPTAAVKRTITGQPLFAADRKPFQRTVELAQAAPAGESGAEVPLPPVELAGTLLTSQRSAALVIADGREVLRLRPGETLDDWKVGHIDVDHIELHHGGQVEAVHLRKTAVPAPGRAALPVDRSVDAAATPECRC